MSGTVRNQTSHQRPNAVYAKQQLYTEVRITYGCCLVKVVILWLVMGMDC